MINTTWLNTFKTLVEIGHFTQTAEKLFMTQPGVSQHIKKLEASLNVELLTREGKSFELTEQGRLMYEYALELASRENMLLERLRYDDPESGSLSFSASGAIITALYPSLLDLQQRYPGLKVNVEAAPNRRIIESISNGIIDSGMVTASIQNPELSAEYIGQLELCLIGSRDAVAKFSASEAINQLGVVDHPDAQYYLQKYIEDSRLKELTQAEWQDFNKVTYINQHSQILQPVSMGIGVTVLPKVAIEYSGYKDKVNVWPTEHLVSEPLYFVKKKRKQLAARYLFLLELIKATEFA
ncbi:MULTISPECIES: LysR family transcriptional regulator [unclassified Vibrio]|uniref:LysR family transcriptional regulator n=1 Tax=unclassified Vibrio TaxID=2614977 RepID=UPI001F065CCB|nr:MULTISPECIES: LysR family transcriptional regulator [unclassified Vibrio]USE03211.1 LysR family transcriptional regulator [Vibrio sp. SCSIO 43133]